MRTITVPAGIGDSVWLLQKLVNVKEKFCFTLPGGEPRRGKQVFDLLPSIVQNCQYSNSLIPYRKIKEKNIQNRHKRWSQIHAQEFYLSCNHWLDTGNRLVDFLPDLPLTYTLPWVIPQKSKESAANLTRKLHEKKKHIIGIYPSSMTTSKAFAGWQLKEWMELIELLYKAAPKTIYCVIGAEWDRDLTNQIVTQCIARKIPVYDCVGVELGYTMEMMQQFTYAFYFPSGLPILNESLPRPSNGVMFYPTALQLMINKWAPEERTRTNALKECVFCHPAEIFTWCDLEYRLIDKLKA